MRRIIVAFMLSALAASAFADIVIGNGKVQSERRSVPAFKAITVSGSGILRVHRGGQKVEITSDSNILPYITTIVAGNELKIGFEPFTNILRATKMQYDITVPELVAVRLVGSGDAYVDAFQGEAFEASVAGSGGMRADLEYEAVSLRCTGSGGFDATVKARSLDYRCSGSGDAFIKGSADRAVAEISGSGTLGAKNLTVDEARIVISGSGKAEVKAEKSLDVVLSGSGDVRYWGRPSVNQRVSGSGRVSRADS